MRPAEALPDGRPLLQALAPGGYTLAGPLVFATVTALLAEGEAAFAGQGAIVIDLAGVTRADSAGLALLLEWSLAARAAGREIRYRNLPEEIIALATLSEVQGLLA